MNPITPEPKNPAEALATKPIRASVAAIAIALMFSLTLNGVMTGVYDLKDRYTTIITEQEQLLAAAAASTKRQNVEIPIVSSQPPQATDRIIVKFKEDNLPPGLSVAAEKANLEKAQGLKKVLTIAGINADVYQVSDEDAAQEVVDRILSSKRDLVEYAEVDMLVAPDLIPNDPSYGSQWHHPIVQTPTAWDTAQGESVTVAVLDTGVNPHPDLALSSVPMRNFYDGSTNVTDVFGHGTKVAGTAAAVGNNGVGGSGIAPKTLILGLKIARDTDGYGSWSAMAQGLTYAADNGARVANISYMSCGSATIQNAATYMRSKGGVVTISAGNYNSDPGILDDKTATCVSATAQGDTKASFSSFGQYVDVAAPGVGIYTTTNSGSYGAVSGTSFSAPLTAGIYALMFSANPALTPIQADNILFQTADDLGEPGWDIYYGHGRVNAAKAVAAAKAAIGTRDTVAPSIPQNLRTTSITSNSITLAWNTATDDNSGVKGYSVYRNGTKLTTVTGTTFTNSGLTPNTTYTYTVRAEDTDGNVSGDSNTLTISTADITFGISTYSVPQKTSTTATINTTLTKPGTVTIKYGTTNTNLTLSAQSSTTNTTHSVPLSGLAANTTYYYQITATDGTTSVTSVVSSFKTSKATGGGKPNR